MENSNKNTQLFPKVSTKRYAVKVNNQTVFTAATRKEAFNYVSSISITDEVKDVTVVNETFTEKVIRSFKPQTNTVTFLASDLGPTID
jgi:hypothetical protein